MHTKHAHEGQKNTDNMDTPPQRHTDEWKWARTWQAYVCEQPSVQRGTEPAPSLRSTGLSLSPGLRRLSADTHCALWMWTHAVATVHTQQKHANTHTHIHMNARPRV